MPTFQPYGSHSSHRGRVTANYVLAGGLLLNLASRRLECRYYVSNCGEIGSAERRPFKELD